MPKGRVLQTLVAVLLLAAGCQAAGQEALLRYTPHVDGRYRYAFALNRPPDPIALAGELHVLGEQETGYQVRFSGLLGDELLAGSMDLSDRHNASHPGYISLNFPDDPVRPGATWRGAVPWYFESHYVLDPPALSLPASYQLAEIRDGEQGRQAVIEQWNEAEVAVAGLVLHVGQVGVRWDGEGRITGLDPGYDAFGNLQIGDVVTGINGQRAATAGDLAWLAEKHIQRPKGERTVAFLVLREGRELEIHVHKSVDELAVVTVRNVQAHLSTVFDVERGILLSAEVTIHQEDVQFQSPGGDPFPVVDDYDSYHKFGYLRGKTAYETRLGSDEIAWTLALVEP